MASTESIPQAPEPILPSDRIPAVAPVWHTAVFVILLSGVALLQATQRLAQRETQVSSRVPLYIQTLLFEFFLVGYVWLGVWLRGVPLKSLIGGRWARWKDFWIDVGVAFLFWLVVSTVLVLLSNALRFNPTEAASFLLPQTVPEMIMWIGVAVSAGFCEELLFRGYLQRQCLALTQNVAAAVILQGLIFGVPHAYQGARGVIVISVYGMLFGALAAIRKSLRPGMMQHATQDTISGFSQQILHFLSRYQHMALIRF